MSMLPRIIGHRGAKESAPENTLASLREAVRQGVRWVEIDVMLTRDRVPVLIHDDRLDRTTSGTGPVADLDLADLRRLDAGSWFDSRFAGETVPTLDECLDFVTAGGLGLNMEIKPYPGQEVATAEAAIALLRRRWPADRPPPLLSSFETVCLEVAQRQAPDWPRGYLMWEPPADWAEIADRLGVATLNVEQSRQTADSVAAYRATGRPVLVYTVNDAARARELFGWGVTSIFTDAPGRMAAALATSRTDYDGFFSHDANPL